MNTPSTIDRHFKIYIAIIYTHTLMIRQAMVRSLRVQSRRLRRNGSLGEATILIIKHLIIKRRNRRDFSTIFIFFHMIVINLHSRSDVACGHARWHEHFTLYLAPYCFRKRGLLDINVTLKCQFVADRHKSRLAISVLSFIYSLYF